MCGLLAAASCMTACNRQATQAENDGKLTLVVGSYASAADEGIRTFTFDQITGECTALCGLRGISNPSFLTVTDDGKRVYAVGENKAEEATANLILLDRQTGSLTLADTKHVHGADPCHLAVSPDSTHLITANYSGGSITIFPLKADGEMDEGQVVQFTGSGPDSTRQECAHLHYVYFSPEGKWLMADDLGSDCIRMFPLAPQTALGIDTTAAREVKLVAGSGPRHAVFDHKGQHLYVINELKGDVVVWEYADGALKQTQSIQADSVGARGSADIHMSPDGQCLQPPTGRRHSHLQGRCRIGAAYSHRLSEHGSTPSQLRHHTQRKVPARGMQRCRLHRDIRAQRRHRPTDQHRKAHRDATSRGGTDGEAIGTQCCSRLLRRKLLCIGHQDLNYKKKFRSALSHTRFCAWTEQGSDLEEVRKEYEQCLGRLWAERRNSPTDSPQR